MKAAHFMRDWVVEQALPGLKWELLKEDARTPLLIFTIPGSSEATNTKEVLMYGHLDK